MFRNSTKSSPAGTLGMPCIPGGAMSDGLCKNGLVCVKGVPSPVCMPPPPPPAPGSYGMPCMNPPIVDPKIPGGLRRCQGDLVCTIVPGIGAGTAVCLPPGQPGPSGPGKKQPGSYGMPCMNPPIVDPKIPGGLRRCQGDLVCTIVPGIGAGTAVCLPPGQPGPSPPTKSGMGSKEILTIIGLIFLGLCFLCGLAKMGMKDAKRKGNCDKACGAFVFLGVTLIAVSSVMKSSN